MLEKNYFIHIPLKEQNDVLDIFESINNRGKKLNLSDNLRFITVKSFIDEPVKQENVNKEWSKLYKNVQKWDVFFKDSVKGILFFGMLTFSGLNKIWFLSFLGIGGGAMSQDLLYFLN